MTNKQLKELEDKLWDSANALRAYGGLKASDYAAPVLGMIFLKFADNKYSQFEDEILKAYSKSKGTRAERSIQEVALATCGFYLPDDARFDYLLNLPGDQSMAKALRTAMEGIEKYQDAKFQDVLPSEAYFDIEKKKKDILPQLLRTFSDIPKNATGDIFGKIYEYFLGKFALSEGQKGGQFFTPTSVVRFIVEVIEPYSGKLYDPACGSGGMFVQSATFIRNAKQDVNDIYVCGQEFMGETVRLAKMNLLVNNLRGEIKEVNSYGSDPFDSYGKFDYVMANPPFNVKSVKEGTVKEDKRFYEYGLPKSKSKKNDSISDANYLWISLFATSLNEQGRAGFVMPNSASDARGAEKEIRKQIVDSGIVDCMVSMPSNMFLTVTLPATLWFFDKNKVHSERKDNILFLDARKVYHQVDRAHREWTEEQQQNLAVIVRLYRGETKSFLALVQRYLIAAEEAIQEVPIAEARLQRLLQLTTQHLKAYINATQEEKRTPAKRKHLAEADFFAHLEQFTLGAKEGALSTPPTSLAATPLDNKAQQQAAQTLAEWVEKNTITADIQKADVHHLSELWQLADKYAKLKNDKSWSEHQLSKANKPLEEALQAYQDKQAQVTYWHEHIQWLQERFPEARYQDVVGLCKVADHSEYVEEQDYSLNAGRYVGVEIEDDNISEEEFKNRINEKFNEFEDLNIQSANLQNMISSRIKELL